jgi:peroxiredoxin
MSEPAPPAAPRPLLSTGDHAPWFRARALSGVPDYAFHSAAGRLVALLFMGSAAWPAVAGALEQVQRNRDLFDDKGACFFGVSIDPQDEKQGRIAQSLPGIRFFMDEDRAVSRLYGALLGKEYQPHWLLLEPTLQVAAAMPLSRTSEFFALLQQRLATPAPLDGWAPVLKIPHVLSADFCRDLIAGYEAHGGSPSGFMREKGGKTVEVVDAGHKQRRDWLIEDKQIQGQINARICGCSLRRSNAASNSSRPASNATSSPATKRARGTSGRTGTTPPKARRTAASPSPSTSTKIMRAVTSVFRNSGHAPTGRHRGARSSSLVRSCTRRRR